MIYLTRAEHFSAAHKMYRQDWSEERNLEVFGRDASPNFHGHNYMLYVTVKGEITLADGYLMDLKQLSTIINNFVIGKLDHQNINLDVDFMHGLMASSELLCIEIFRLLKPPIEANEGVYLHSVKLFETENNFVEYLGN